MRLCIKLFVSFSIISCMVISCESDDQRFETAVATGGQVFPPADHHEIIDSDGALIDLRDYQGKIVLLNFWATWCGPCRIEIPALVKLRSEYDSGQLAIIGVSLDQGPSEKVRKLLGKFIKRYEINYPIVLGGDGELLKKVIGGSMRSLGIPMTFLFDRQGKIHAKHIGVPRGADPYWILKEDLKRLL
ncbi:MAG: TlpA disulfide reductase family protein [Candidatus Latescibacterota bacterium]|nr:TlpA disulfide reductase family protein [Candidatus Latescibacterota bacterium]